MRIYISMLFLATALSSFSQEVFLEGGLTTSNFEFTNSNGQELENLNSVRKGYLSVGFSHEISTEGLNVSVGASHNSYGSVGSDDVLGTFFEYDVDYLGINLGFDYELFTFYDFTPFLKVNASYEFLLQGTQRLNNQVFNLKGVEEFDDAGIFFRGGLGVSYPISEKSTIYVLYTYGQSLDLEDTSPNSNEKLKIYMNNIGIGFTLSLPPTKEKEIEEEIEIEE